MSGSKTCLRELFSWINRIYGFYKNCCDLKERIKKLGLFIKTWLRNVLFMGKELEADINIVGASQVEFVATYLAIGLRGEKKHGSDIKYVSCGAGVSLSNITRASIEDLYSLE